MKTIVYVRCTPLNSDVGSLTLPLKLSPELNKRNNISLFEFYYVLPGTKKCINHPNLIGYYKLAPPWLVRLN